MKTTLFVLALVSVTCTTLIARETRTWTDRLGKYQIEAEFVSVEGPNVNIKKTDGKVVSVPIEKLSDADRQYLVTTQVANRSPVPNPAAGTSVQGAMAALELTTFRDLNRLLEKQREANFSLGILKSYLATDGIDSQEHKLAERELPHWKELADQRAIRVGNKWVPPAQFEQMKDDEIRLIKEAHRLIDIKSDQTAKERFLSASDANPQGVRADFYLGLLNGLVAKYPPDAEKHFQECVRRLAKDEDLLNGTRKANYVAALNNLAVAQVRTRKYDDAIGTWRTALEIAPSTPELVQNLGLMTKLAESATFVRIPKGQRTSAASLYAKVTVQNSLGRFDDKVGWLLIPYIDTLDGSIDESGDEEFVNIGWCTGFSVGSGFVVTSRHPLMDADRVVVHSGANIFQVPTGKVVALSDKSNLALLKIEGIGGKGLPLGCVENQWLIAKQ